MSLPLTVAITSWDLLEKPSVFLNKSAKTNENNAIAITITRKSPRCLILFKIAI
jgi:hypothetical protein